MRLLSLFWRGASRTVAVAFWASLLIALTVNGCLLSYRPHGYDAGIEHEVASPLIDAHALTITTRSLAHLNWR